MNVGAHVTGGDRLPLIDYEMFMKLQHDGRVVGKVLAVREIDSPKFKGLALDLKNGTEKFGFLCSFDRFDVGAIVSQIGSQETDDWIGQSIRFVAKKGSKGNRMFVNVEYVKAKKKRS